MKKNVYLFQIPSTFDQSNPVYFPYSVGLLWGYAQQFDKIKLNYNLKELIFLRENPTEIIQRLDNPKIVGFSCYVWNMNYNMQLAKIIKKNWPDCTVIVGGPHVPVKNNNFFQDHPYIDIAIYREGEITFKEVLECLADKDQVLDSIPGLGINRNQELVRTTENARTKNLDDIPSPYLLGLFDGMKELCDSKGITINALIETNRGCPYKCTFCDWGNGALGKVVKFDLKRIKKELLWFAKNKIEFVVNCDANFGILKDKDYEIAKFLVKLKKRYGYPETFDTNWPKNSNSNTVNLAKLFMENKMLRRFTTSLQSQNENTLQAIKRKNLSNDQITAIVEYAKSNGIETNVELIVGLPNDTYNSFQENFSALVEKGVHPTSDVLTILPNSEMADHDYRKKYDLQSRINEKEMLYVNEYDEIVVSNNTTSKAELERLILWIWFVQQFHLHGYTNILFDFCNKRYGIGIKDFYNKFLDLALEEINQFPNKEIYPLKNHIDKNLTYKLSIGSVNTDFHNRIGEKNRKEVFDGLKNILLQMLKQEDCIYADDLILLQNYNQYSSMRENLSTLCLNYNLFEYLYNNQPLIKTKSVYKVEQNIFDLDIYGENLVRSRFNRKWKNKITSLQEV